MSKFNWSKAKKLKEYEDVDGKDPKKVYSGQYFNKLKAKAIEITRKRGIYNFDKFGPKNLKNPAFKPKSHDEQGTGPSESQLDMGATYGDKDWDAETRIEGKLHETYSTDVFASASVTTNNKMAVTRYNGNVADFVTHKNSSTKKNNT